MKFKYFFIGLFVLLCLVLVSSKAAAGGESPNMVFLGNNFDGTPDTTGRVGLEGDSTKHQRAQRINNATNMAIDGLAVQWDAQEGVHEGDEMLHIRIETNGGGHPSGTLADANAFINITFADILDGQWQNFSFPATLSLSTSTDYWIVWDFGGGVEAGETVVLSLDNENTYPLGEAEQDIDDAGWNNVGADYIFAIFQNATNPASLNISTTPYPLNTSFIQIAQNTVNFNVSVNSSNNFNCSLYLNETLNQTDTFSAATHGVNWTLNVDDGHYTYKISCFNATALAEAQTNTTTHLFKVDTVQPVITPDTAISTNTSIARGGNLTGSINFSDPELYYINITIGGTSIFNISNLDTPLYIYNFSNGKDISSFPAGNLNMIILACDGHTARDIDPWQYSQKKDELIFNNDLKITAVGATSSDVVLELDRYSPIFTYSKPSLYKTYYIESQHKIEKTKRGEYKGWFVIPATKRWIDFEDGTDAHVEYTQLAENKWEVKVYNPESRIQFNSVGELNCNNITRQIFNQKIEESHESTLLAGASTDFQFNLTYNSSWFSSIDVDLWYNGTRYAMIETVGADKYTYDQTLTTSNFNDNITFWYEYELNGVKYNTTEYQQETIQASIDDCSTFTTIFANFTLRDEITDVILSGNLNYNFDWGTNNYNGSKTAVKSVNFCINPAYANFTADTTIEYSATGYDTRTFQDTIYRADNKTNNETLFLLSTGNSTDITIHVIDDNDDDLEGVLIKAYKWNIAEDVDELVQSETTDVDGNTLFQLQLGTFHKLEFYQAGTLVLSTSRFKIVSTNLEYVINIVQATRLQEWLELQEIDWTLTFSNTTNAVTFDWDDSLGLGDRYCLNITASNGTRYSSQCSTSQDSSLSFTITEFNVSYIAQGIVRRTGTNNYYVLDSLGIDKRTGMRDWFGDSTSLGIGLLMFLFIGLLGMKNKNLGMISGILGIITLYLFGIIPSFTMMMGLLVLGVIILIVINKRFN